jgi:hypothetical protein
VGDDLTADHERYDLRPSHLLAGVHHLAVVQRVHRDAFEPIDEAQRFPSHGQEAAMRRTQRPVPSTARAGGHAPSGCRLRQPRPGDAFVDVAGLRRDDVEFVPRQLAEAFRVRRTDDAALRQHDLSGRVADVAGEH